MLKISRSRLDLLLIAQDPGKTWLLSCVLINKSDNAMCHSAAANGSFSESSDWALRDRRSTRITTQRQSIQWVRLIQSRNAWTSTYQTKRVQTCVIYIFEMWKPSLGLLYFVETPWTRLSLKVKILRAVRIIQNPTLYVHVTPHLPKMNEESSTKV